MKPFKMKPFNHYKQWDHQEEATLVDLHLGGTQIDKTAEYLGRTNNAVINKLMQIKCSPTREQESLHNKLNEQEPEGQRMANSYLGKHLIYGMKLCKITKVFITNNNTVFVYISNFNDVRELGEVKGSIVKEEYFV